MRGGGEGEGGGRIATGLLGKGEGGSPETFELAIVSQIGFFSLLVISLSLIEKSSKTLIGFGLDDVVSVLKKFVRSLY